MNQEKLWTAIVKDMSKEEREKDLLERMDTILGLHDRDLSDLLDAYYDEFYETCIMSTFEDENFLIPRTTKEDLKLIQGIIIKQGL